MTRLPTKSTKAKAFKNKLAKALRRSSQKTYVFVPFKASVTVTKIDEEMTEGLWEGQYDYDAEDFAQDMDLSYQLLGREQDSLEKKGSIQVIRYLSSTRHSLSHIQSGDKFYVIGHCCAGSKEIASQEGGGERLDADGLADRLIARGLPQNRPIIIKLYACEGGARTLWNRSFADRLSRELKGRTGYSLIKVQGYTKTITHKFKPQDGKFSKGDPHKWAKNSKGKVIGRAKNYRKTFG